MKTLALAVTAALGLSVSTTTALANCGSQPDSCMIAEGDYEAKLPPNSPENAPMVVFLHGYGGNGNGSLGRKSLVQPILNRGYGIIAPNALMRGSNTSWNFHPQRGSGRDEAAFIRAVIKDAAARFNLNPDRVLLAGFSIGGSMTSYLACQTPDIATAFAPVSGSFWRPHPTECAAPVRLLHTHGWRDGTVPLEGRTVGSGFTQGDVFYAMSLWASTNKCEQPRADSFDTTAPFWRRSWTECAPDSALELALFDGGHVVPDGWADMALDWFAAAVPE